MRELCLFNLVLVAVIVLGLVAAKKWLKSEWAVRILLVVSPILTILCHYSSLVYHLIEGGTAIPFLQANPNLLLPIYPCNVVMWGCLVYGLLRKKESRLARALADYIFWFGVVSCVVGMFANVDFLMNPGFEDYDTVKNVIAHGFMFFNVLALAVFGRVRIDLPRNLLHIVISVVGMYLIGLYNNLLAEAIASYGRAYQINSMFILHSPFEGLPFLRYPLIALVAVAVYFGIFSVAELFAYRKGNRWISRLSRRKEGTE